MTALCCPLADQQSSSASLETLLALLQAEGAKIEEDTEVRPSGLQVPKDVLPGSRSPWAVSKPRGLVSSCRHLHRRVSSLPWAGKSATERSRGQRAVKCNPT